MKKYLITILLVLLTGCSQSVPFGAEEEITSINIDGEMVSIEFTDENVGEDIIIKSDQKEYFNLGGTFTMYFSVENKTGIAQDIETVFALKTGDILEVFEYDGNIEEDVIVEIPNATSTELGVSAIEKKTTSKWKSKSLKKADKYKKDLLGATEYIRKDIKETEATKLFTDSFEIDEKKFYKASVKIVSGDREEFFLETFGADLGYGHLDPWSYEQDFDSLNDGALVGQDSWTKTSGTDASNISSTYALLSTTKGVVFPVTASLNCTITRTISGGTEGIVYFATKVTTVAPDGHAHAFSLDGGTTYGVFANYARVDADTYKISGYTDAGYVDMLTGLSKDTTYIVAIEYDNAGDQYRMKVKAQGGSFGAFSNWGSYYTAQVNMTRFRIVKDWGWGVIMDEFSATDPDTPAPTPAVEIKRQSEFWF